MSSYIVVNNYIHRLQLSHVKDPAASWMSMESVFHRKSITPLQQTQIHDLPWSRHLRVCF